MESIQLEKGTDLNLIQTPGMYYCPSIVDATTMNNLPQKLAFCLLVEKHAGYKQTFTMYETDFPSTWVRNFYNDRWGEWEKLAFVKDAFNYKGAINGDDLSWNAESGIYEARIYDNQGVFLHENIILHFNMGQGSCPAVQFMFEYANKGIYYRSAKDNHGFENSWAKLATIEDIPTSLPASDVYSWAKQASKPSYSASEISGMPKVTTGANPPASGMSKGDIFIKTF